MLGIGDCSNTDSSEEDEDLPIGNFQQEKILEGQKKNSKSTEDCDVETANDDGEATESDEECVASASNTRKRPLEESEQHVPIPKKPPISDGGQSTIGESSNIFIEAETKQPQEVQDSKSLSTECDAALNLSRENPSQKTQSTPALHTEPGQQPISPKAGKTLNTMGPEETMPHHNASSSVHKKPLNLNLLKKQHEPSAPGAPEKETSKAFSDEKHARENIKVGQASGGKENALSNKVVEKRNGGKNECSDESPKLAQEPNDKMTDAESTSPGNEGNITGTELKKLGEETISEAMPTKEQKHAELRQSDHEDPEDTNVSETGSRNVPQVKVGSSENGMKNKVEQISHKIQSNENELDLTLAPKSVSEQKCASAPKDAEEEAESKPEVEGKQIEPSIDDSTLKSDFDDECKKDEEESKSAEGKCLASTSFSEETAQPSESMERTGVDASSKLAINMTTEENASGVKVPMPTETEVPKDVPHTQPDTFDKTSQPKTVAKTQGVDVSENKVIEDEVLAGGGAKDSGITKEDKLKTTDKAPPSAANNGKSITENEALVDKEDNHKPELEGGILESDAPGTKGKKRPLLDEGADQAGVSSPQTPKVVPVTTAKKDNSAESMHFDDDGPSKKKVKSQASSSWVLGDDDSEEDEDEEDEPLPAFGADEPPGAKRGRDLPPKKIVTKKAKDSKTQDKGEDDSMAVEKDDTPLAKPTDQEKKDVAVEKDDAPLAKPTDQEQKEAGVEKDDSPLVKATQQAKKAMAIEKVDASLGKPTQKGKKEAAEQNKAAESVIQQLKSQDDNEIDEERQSLKEDASEKSTTAPASDQGTQPEEQFSSFLMVDDSEEEDDVDEDIPLSMPAASAKYMEARERITANCWDTDAWATTLEEARKQQAGISYQEACHQFLAQFPKAGRVWSALGQWELEKGRLSAVDDLLATSLLPCCSLDLWLFYLRKSERTFLTDRNLTEDRYAAETKMQSAYEFAIEHYGYNLDADQIWWRYINFLKTWPNATPADHGRKITAMRKAYQRCVVLAVKGVTVFWRQYESFERELSDQLAAKLLADLQSRHNSAVLIEKDRTKKQNGIDKTRLSVPPKGTKEEKMQLRKWSEWIQYEKSNPELVDATGLRARVRSSYQQCLCCMDRFPEIWYDYAQYEISNEDYEAAALIYKNAVQVLPDSLLLSTAYSRLEDCRANTNLAKTILEAHVQKYPSTIGFINLQRLVRRTEGKEAARKLFSGTKQLRKEKKLSYHIYLANAEIEQFINQDPHVCHRVFELGLKSDADYISQPEYILAYADFLSHQGDWISLRNLYERSLATKQGASSRAIWDSFLEFEMRMVLHGGNFDSIKAVEKRRAEKFPELDQEEGLLKLWNELSYSASLSISGSDQIFLNRVQKSSSTKDSGAGSQKKKAQQRQQASLDFKQTKNFPPKIPGRETPTRHDDYLLQSQPVLPPFLHKLFVTIREVPTGNNFNVDAVLDMIKVTALPSLEAVIEKDAERNKQGKHRMKSAHYDQDGNSDEDSVLIKGYEVPVKQRSSNDIFRNRQRERLKKLGKSH